MASSSSSPTGSPVVSSATLPSVPPPSGTLKGRKVTLGSVLPKSMVAGGCLSLLLGIILLTVGILIGNGTLTAPDWLGWGCKVIGGLMLVGIPLNGYFIYKEFQLRKESERLLANRPEPEPILPPDPSPASSLAPPSAPSLLPAPAAAAAPVAPPPIDEAEWTRRLNEEGKQDGVYYNLANPGEPIASLSGMSHAYMPIPQLPLFGKYGEDGFGPDNCLMAARLPSAQLAQFPRNLREWFERDRCADKAECFFMVFDNREEKEDAKRNLALHAMALPEYDSAHPSVPTGKSEGVTPIHPANKKLHGLKTSCKIAFFAPDGIEVKNSKQIADATDTLRFSNTTLYLHGEKDKIPKVSFFKEGGDPPRAEFEIDTEREVSSAFFGAMFRGRGVAIHALFLNDDSKGQGAKLTAALAKDNVEAFLSHLEAGGDFPPVRPVFEQA